MANNTFCVVLLNIKRVSQSYIDTEHKTPLYDPRRRGIKKDQKKKRKIHVAAMK
jgi:hypothetical protein